jgi:hypothetical protein
MDFWSEQPNSRPDEREYDRYQDQYDQGSLRDNQVPVVNIDVQSGRKPDHTDEQSDCNQPKKSDNKTHG